MAGAAPAAPADPGAGWTSGWVSLPQERIADFAEVTLDRQAIHLDPDAAAASGFGGTIAHGFLTLSLLSHMLVTALPRTGAGPQINYGFDRVRFVSAVPSGARVRGHFTLAGATLRRPGERLRATPSGWRSSAERPALTADWLVLEIGTEEG